MTRLFGRRAPIGVQVALLLTLSVLIAQAANLALVLVVPRPDRPDFRPAAVARLLTGAETADGFTVSTREAAPPDDYEDPEEREFRAALAAALEQPEGEVRAIFKAGPEADGFVAARQTEAGGWRWLSAPQGGLDAWQRRALLWLLVSTLLVAPLGWLFARRFTRPVQAFARSAEKIGRNPHAEPIAVTGPAEIEDAAAAIRGMQAEIARYVEDRTSMVAAIAHDLRTPLTRLAFRLEALPDSAREKAMADIDEMQRMIAGALDFVRGSAVGGERRPVELSALLARVVADVAHEGAPVTLAPHPPVDVLGDADALHRLLSNLALNAIRYGGGAAIRLKADPDAAVVEIDDDGPGIPEDELERVFAPFYRIEASRNRAHGGAGLGLAIARSIAAAHGGTLALSNRAAGGLTARLALPIG